MKFFKALYTCVLLLWFYSCGTFVKKAPSDNFKRMIINENKNGYAKIRFDGGYSFIGTKEYVLECPVYFFENGLSHLDCFSYKQMPIFKNCEELSFLAKKDWGAFEIVGDTIKVTTYYMYFGQPSYNLETNFQGIIKNKDTITNWHITPPYPKLIKARRRDYDFLFKMNDTLVFKSLDFKKCVDSVSEKVVFRGVLH